jgi:hypothetical protein
MVDFLLQGERLDKKRAWMGWMMMAAATGLVAFLPATAVRAQAISAEE